MTSEETIDVPAREVRRWLHQHDDAQPVADITIPDAPDDEPPPPDLNRQHESGRAPRCRDGRHRPQVLRHRRDGRSEIINALRVQPGDTIIVPIEYGGCDRFGWHPDSATPVVDVADLAARTRGPILRIGPHLQQLVTHLAVPFPGTRDPHGTTDHTDRQQDVIDELLRLTREHPKPEQPHAYADLLPALLAALPTGNPLGQVVQSLLGNPLNRRRPPFTVTPTRQIHPRTGATWTPEFPIVLSAARPRYADDASEYGSSSTAHPHSHVGLDAHHHAVAARAARTAHAVGLDRRLVAAVEAAGRWHDEGKRDIRFQAMLLGGNRAVADLAPAPFAKCGINPANHTQARRAREAAAYPLMMRHEALSARIAEFHLADQQLDIDVELVLHLIASHHGRSRSLLPPVTDPDPVEVTVPGHPTLTTEVTVDWRSPARFHRLNHTYGRWGLALLETIVRLADIWCSTHDGEPQA
ncbi:hypothetical protein E1091_10490 [Micromonospora fluostatini]|uniref:HD Cas3-type domain-containing protein n=1 Tax=Micromonospora fluostatini TaxID=1629071 RepID=A0ABY2DGP2_9ACTN|nr:hypothetical protein E1091_10490 [Micromonospora fluostatini]